MRRDTDPLAPWTVTAQDFPIDEGPRQRNAFLLRYAILAPSGHNTQPWLFRVSDEGVELRADRTRGLPVVDPDDRELIVSCGAALATFRIAARHFGQRTRVDVLPDPGDEDLLARITVAPGGPEEADDAGLFAAIPERRTNRRAFDDRTVPDNVVNQLLAEAEQERVALHVARGDQRTAIAALIAEGDRIQMADKRFRRELAAWVHPNRSRSGDGMRGYGFGFGDLMSYAGPTVIRSFDLGKRQAAKDHALADGSPLLAVFVTSADEPAAWLATGAALQRVLLRARATNLWASFLNQPVEVPELRPGVAAAIGRPDGFPQLVVRFGYGTAVAPEPRREVDDVLIDAV